MNSSLPSELFRRYAWSIGAIALFLSVGGGVVASGFESQAAHFEVINVAGRQRMLSQRISKEAALSLLEPERFEVHASRARDNLEVWARAHTFLRDGDADHAPLRSPAIDRAYDDTARSLERATKAAHVALNPDASRVARQTAVRTLQEAERAFLAQMELFVFLLERESATRLERHTWLIAGLVALTLLALAAQLLHIVRPMTRRLQENAADLQNQHLELLDARAQTERAASATTSLLSTLDHELRSPLGAVIGYAELVREDLNSDAYENMPADLDQILASSRDLLALLSDVLILSKLSAGILKLDHSPFDPLPSFATCVQRAHQASPEVELLFELHALPAQVTGDVVRLEHAFGAVLSHAIARSKPGARVLVRLAGAQQGLRLEVSDTGPALTEEARAKLFEPFSQGPGEGSGLGLAIAHGLVELMGGEIGVDCPEEGGVTLWVNLCQKERNLAVV